MNCNGDVPLFRVRKSWKDIASQKGAFFILENAVKIAKQNGCNVYNNNKECVFSFKKEFLS